MKIQSAVLLLALLTVSDRHAGAEWELVEMVTVEAKRPTYNSLPVEERFLNPWPAELEAGFQRRADEVITAQTRGVKTGVNTSFENEKRSYGFTMAHLLGSNDKTALKDLQAQDYEGLVESLLEP